MTNVLTVPSAPRASMAPFKPERLLMPTDQIVRRPLAAWSRELAGEVRAAAAMVPSDSYERCAEVIRCGNNASLVMIHHGDTTAAYDICRAQLAWLRSIVMRHRRPDLWVLSLQPWINLGRLHSRTGSPDRGLVYFADILACTSSATPRLDGLDIDPAHWQLLGWTEADAAPFGRAVYIVDSLSVLLAAKRYEEMLAFSRSGIANGSRRLSFHVQEAELIAAGRLGRYEEAIQAVHRYRAAAPSWEKMVLHLRWAEVLELAGDSLGALRILSQLVEVCERLPLAKKGQLLFVLMVQQVVGAAFALSGSEHAVQLTGQLYRAAVRLDDEVLRVDLLRMLAEHAASTAQRLEHREELERVLETTGYARLAPRGTNPAGSEEVRALYSAVMEVLWG